MLGKLSSRAFACAYLHDRQRRTELRSSGVLNISRGHFRRQKWQFLMNYSDARKNKYMRDINMNTIRRYACFYITAFENVSRIGEAMPVLFNTLVFLSYDGSASDSISGDPQGNKKQLDEDAFPRSRTSVLPKQLRRPRHQYYKVSSKKYIQCGIKCCSVPTLIILITAYPTGRTTDEH